MKKLFIVLAILAIPAMAWSGPFLVCDPQAGISSYRITQGDIPISVPAQADGSLRYDVGSSAVGQNSLSVAACSSEGTVWEACSENVPFDYTRPALTAPSSPVGLRLAK